MLPFVAIVLKMIFADFYFGKEEQIVGRQGKCLAVFGEILARLGILTESYHLVGERIERCTVCKIIATVGVNGLTADKVEPIVLPTEKIYIGGKGYAISIFVPLAI